MFLSAFTPSHRPAHLAGVWDCLRRQTHANWEWVVVPNGPRAADVTDLTRKLADGDGRVRIVPHAGSGVGALKRFACQACNGDAFVEVDHDDLITADCLSVVAAKLAGKDQAFFYSDAVTASFSGESHLFSACYGWRQYPWEYAGRTYAVNAGYAPHPRMLCEILYGPDHVRAWTRKGYWAAGGHDATLTVGDDHALVVETYLAGAEFVWYPKPLYVHRLNADTTSQQNLPEIQAVSTRVRDTKLRPLVAEWCRRAGLPMLDLGGAHNRPAGFIPVDKALRTEPVGGIERLRASGVWPVQIGGDVPAVLETLPNNSVGCFRAADFLEHVPPGRVVELMNVVHAKLVPGGFFLTDTPAVCDDDGRCGRGAYQDPTHVSFWSSNNFWYFTDREFAKFVPEVRCRFQTVVAGNGYPSDWHRAHLIPYVRWDGMALKDDERNRFPGPRQI